VIDFASASSSFNEKNCLFSAISASPRDYLFVARRGNLQKKATETLPVSMAFYLYPLMKTTC